MITCSRAKLLVNSGVSINSATMPDTAHHSEDSDTSSRRQSSEKRVLSKVSRKASREILNRQGSVNDSSESEIAIPHGHSKYKVYAHSDEDTSYDKTQGR